MKSARPSRASTPKAGGATPSQFLYGVRPVIEAIRSKRRSLGELWLVRDPRSPRIAEVVALAEAAGVPVRTVDPQALESAVGEGASTQGVALKVGGIPEVELESLLAEPSPRQLVALDGVEDPQNLGTILRVSEAAGVQGLLLTRRRSPPLSPAVARASAGALEHVPVARVGNLRTTFKSLKKKGFWVIGADSHQGEDLFDAPSRVYEGDLIWLFGAEGSGIRAGLADAVDHWVRIPMQASIGSLNVGTAAAVLLFEGVRRRRNRDP